MPDQDLDQYAEIESLADADKIPVRRDSDGLWRYILGANMGNARAVTLTGATNLNVTTHRAALIDLQDNTLTIVADATTSYDDNQQGVVWSSHASGGTVTVPAGVTLNDVDGGSASVSKGVSFGFYRKGTDDWWIFNATVS